MRNRKISVGNQIQAKYAHTKMLIKNEYNTIQCNANRNK